MSFSSRLNQTEHTGAQTRLGHPANFRCGNEGNLGMGQKRPDPKTILLKGFASDIASSQQRDINSERRGHYIDSSPERKIIL